MTEVLAAQIPRRSNSSQAIARRIVVAIALLTLTWSICLVVGIQSWKLQWAANIVLPMTVVALIVILTMRREHRLHGPLKSINALLLKVRSGEEPMDALEKLSIALPAKDPEAIALRALVDGLLDVLRDVKRQRVELATLNEEMRLRIAGRTDALERTIGSLRIASERDPLTALGNRRAMESMLPRWIEASRRDRTPLCVLVIDVDYFKQLNDTLGHAAGDEFLRDLGKLIRSTVRPTDMAFRLGGDEFLIVLPTSDATSANKLSARLASLVDALTETIRVMNRPRLSIGIAQLSDLPDRDSEGAMTRLLSLADQRLYVVKAQRKSMRR